MAIPRARIGPRAKQRRDKLWMVRARGLGQGRPFGVERAGERSLGQCRSGAFKISGASGAKKSLIGACGGDFVWGKDGERERFHGFFAKGTMCRRVAYVEFKCFENRAALGVAIKP